MSNPVSLSVLLAAAVNKPGEQRQLFAFLTLGIIESLANGLLSATESVRIFFNAENCSLVRKRFKKGVADQVMGRGVQLPDLFDTLPPEEAYREFQKELATMRSLCLKLLDEKKQVVRAPLDNGPGHSGAAKTGQ
jgi:hypothetical protein